MSKGNKSRFWNFVDHLEGDKVVWMIVLLLILFSIVAIFSSTTLLAIQSNTTRMAIISEQLIVSLLGLCVIVFLCYFRSLKIIKFFSKYAFFACVLLLGFLAAKMDIGVLRAQTINDATRTILVFGKIQFHVFEFTKIAMVMYLAWAIDAMDSGKLTLGKTLAKLTGWRPLATDFGTKFIYIYAPIAVVILLVFLGSVSSAMFIGMIMVVTILVGGVSIKELLLPGFVGVLLIGGIIWGGYTITDGKAFNRIATAMTRLGGEDYISILEQNKDDKNSKAFTDAADKSRQPVGAEIAIKEGGLFGKGPGASTQKYVVPVMFEDYMFSFIVEEYGLIFGGLTIIILYISLMARGAAIVKGCKTTYEKAMVAGFTILITGQAFMHMMINVHLFPLTGQTLPLISHGASSFVMFCVAFGLILCVSRMSKKQLEMNDKKILETGSLSFNTTARYEEEEEEELDEVRATISDVEEIEDQFND